MVMFNLIKNPFQNQFTYDFSDYKSQPFIVEGMFQTPIVLKRKLEWNCQAGAQSCDRILLKVLSEQKGAGKSTLSFFLQDCLAELNKSSILYFYHNNFNYDYFDLLKDIRERLDIPRYSSNEEAIKKFLEDKHLYLFIDFQDELTNQNFKLLANILQSIPLLSRNISIILTMNKNHALKMENYSLVLGKYTPFDLPPFSLENTKSLIIERLKLARSSNYKGSEIYPFENVIDLIHSYSGGLPRNIISACDLLLSHFGEQDEGTIDKDEANLLFKGDFSKKVISDNTSEGFERTVLYELYAVIRDKFKGEVNKEKDLKDYMNQNYGWASVTTGKRLRKLVKFNLINITKGLDLWSNVIRIG
jgi:hypothetical protein